MSIKWVFDKFGDIDSYWSINKIIPPFIGGGDFIWVEKFDLIDNTFTEEYKQISYGDFKNMQEDNNVN
jgi:hypothetical protein